MKVALVCSEKLPVPPVRGGAIQQYIEGVLPYLAKDHEITVYGIADRELPEREEQGQVSYVRFRTGSRQGYIKSVASALGGEQFDLVHVFNRPRALTEYYRAAPGARYILSVHNDMFAPNKITPEEGDFCLEHTEVVVTVSDYIRKNIEELYPQARGKAFTVYSGVDPERFRPGWTPEGHNLGAVVRERYGIGNATVVLLATRFSEKKGVHVIIEAMDKVIREDPRVVLLVVGSKWYGSNKVNDYVASIFSQAQVLGSQVIFTGFVPPAKMPEYYAAGDIFVCASQWQEPLARVHYEAMSAGLPIITTNRGGNPEVVAGQGNGLILCGYDQPDDFAWAINYLLANPRAAREMGRQGRRLAESRFSWARVAGELLTFYEKITG